MLLVIDNYDSFTFNLVQYLGELGEEIEVRKNDEITCEQIDNADSIRKVVISPGPGTPDDAGVSMEVVRRFSGRFPILGVCLGHQAIAQVYGGRIERADYPVHGKPWRVNHNGKGLFRNISDSFEVGRYHSLVVSKTNFPEDLEITAETREGVVMGLQHKELELFGVQFHPESILTPEGKNLLHNFVSI
ncbi:MAG: aminodeoxychorismate/anthranilate synthase component II [Pyrinomonadaceae bacterium]|nr:aminodeoxychorismate/anthranilate synthase component II [Pyrinomonadaceae bacterium]